MSIDIKLHKNDLPDDLNLGNVLAVDGEFMGLDVSRDPLCLIQLSSGNEDAHIVALEVKMTRDDDVARMAGIKTYRGMRHRSGHKVRGQRLRSNGRKGSALGVQRKK